MSTVSLTKLTETLSFPDPNFALTSPNGLLAFGGDLSVDRLLKAYRQGIFPWFSEGEPILWWSPDPRGVLLVDNYKASKSLIKFMGKTSLAVTLNHQFDQVIERCATISRRDNGTWINRQMVDAYKKLHLAGHAHSVEVWQNQQLIGGLYGVFVNHTFCGESMFSEISNASKVAFHHLVTFLRRHQVSLIDCQMQNPHLQLLGCQIMPRTQFLRILQSTNSATSAINWHPQDLNRPAP